MKAFLYSFLICLCYSSAAAQSDDDFHLVSLTKEGMEVYAYVEKTNYDGSKNTWIKFTVPLKSIKNKKGKIVKTGGETTMMFVKMDCENREYDLMEIAIYNRSGEIKSHDEPLDFNNKIIPGSVMSFDYNSVCSE